MTTSILAISNIPFGDVAVFDPSYTAMKGMRALVTRRIHNYFFVKALDTVRVVGWLPSSPHKAY